MATGADPAHGKPVVPAKADNAPKVLSLKSRALRLLAQREHTRHELEQKLKDHPDATTGLAPLLDRFEQVGLVNESRVMASVLHRRAGQRGALRIANELQQKGVSAALIAQAQDELKSTEIARAHAIWQKKFGTRASTPKEQARQWRFMSSRGFEAGVLRQILAGSPDSDDGSYES